MLSKNKQVAKEFVICIIYIDTDKYLCAGGTKTYIKINIKNVGIKNSDYSGMRKEDGSGRTTRLLQLYR